MTGAYFSRARFNYTPFSTNAAGNERNAIINIILEAADAECTALSGAQISIEVTLKPGYVLEINTETMEVLLNGELLLDAVQGLSLAMLPEVTDIFYHDKALSIPHNTECTLIYTDRYY